MTTGKTIALTRQTFVGKVMSLLFNMLSRFVIAFLPRSKCLLVSWLQSWSAVILEPKKKSVTVSIFPTSICHEVMGPDAMILIFWMLSFKPLFHSPLSPSSRASLVLLCFLLLGWCHLHIWGYWYFSQHSWFQLVFTPPLVTLLLFVSKSLTFKKKFTYYWYAVLKSPCWHMFTKLTKCREKRM